jgi:hypothetical protein
MAWTPAVFRHTDIAPGTCMTCHNGAMAPGKPTNHVMTTASCDTCHRVTGWTPVIGSATRRGGGDRDRR